MAIAARELGLVRETRCDHDAAGFEGGPIPKALRILQAFSSGGQLGVSELSRTTGIPKSSVHRVCSELVEHGFLVRTDRRSYRLGLQLFQLGHADRALSSLRSAGARFLRDLAVMTGETVHFAVLDGTDVLYLEKVDAPGPTLIPSRIGQRNPAHCTGLGKALLAWNPAARTKLLAHHEYPAYTPRTITDPARLDAELDRVREQRIAYDRQERTVGIVCVAGALRNTRGESVAAISVSAPATRMTESRLSEVASAVTLVAESAQEYLRRRRLL